jgi:hypothetical protein
LGGDLSATLEVNFKDENSAGSAVRREWFAMPWQDGSREHFIWGATAGMLRNLYRFLSA